MEAAITAISAEIRRANDQFESIFANGDAASMAKLYTEDGMLLPTGSDFVKGPQAIQDFWQGAIKMGIKQAKLNSMEVEQYGDTAIEVGNYALNGEGGQLIDQGKYVVIWKQQNGQWKLHRDIWNSSVATQ
jgi:uncharacterized protein (TIGR02246 family)